MEWVQCSFKMDFFIFTPKYSPLLVCWHAGLAFGKPWPGGGFLCAEHSQQHSGGRHPGAASHGPDSTLGGTNVLPGKQGESKEGENIMATLRWMFKYGNTSRVKAYGYFLKVCVPVVSAVLSDKADRHSSLCLRSHLMVVSSPTSPNLLGFPVRGWLSWTEDLMLCWLCVGLLVSSLLNLSFFLR